MNPQLAEHLRQLSFDALGEIDHGNLRLEVDDALREVLDHISKYPCRDGLKTEPRKVTIELLIEPIIHTSMKATEGSSGTDRRPTIEIAGLALQAKVYPSKPRFRSPVIKALTKVKNGRILECSFNPSNNTAPEHLDLEFEGDDGPS